MASETGSLLEKAVCCAMLASSATTSFAAYDWFDGEVSSPNIERYRQHGLSERTPYSNGLYYVIGNEEGNSNSSSLCIFQDENIESVRNAVKEVTSKILGYEQDFEPKVKRLIADNLWELYD